MPWLKSDDDMPNNEKIWALSDPLYRLYEAGRFYAAKNLTDGHVPANRIVQLTPNRATKAQINAIVRARLWHDLTVWSERPCESCLAWRKRKDAGPLPKSGYLVHDYLEYNPSKAQWTREDEQRKEAGRAGGLEKARRRSESLSVMPSAALSDALAENTNSASEMPSEPLGRTVLRASSEMPSGTPSPYPVPRIPVPGSIDPVPSADDPFPEDADRSRDRVRRGGVRHVGGAAAALVAAARARAS